MNAPTASVSGSFLSTVPEHHDDGVSVRSPVVTDYVLTRQQEDDLCTHLHKRIDDLSREMGRDLIAGNATWWMNGSFSMPGTEFNSADEDRPFMAKRALFHQMALSQYHWRPFMLGGVYEDSNLSLPMLESVLDKSTSKANKEFFGTDPWVSTFAVNANADSDFAIIADRFVNFKFRKGGIKQGLKQAVNLAGIQGECVVKTTHKIDDTFYEKTLNLMVNAEGLPLIALDGDYIEEKAQFVAAPIVDPNTQLPVVDSLGVAVTQRVLKRDMKTPAPPPGTYTIERKKVTMRKVRYEGPSAEPIFYQDLLCPLNADSLQTADCVIHLQDRPVARLMDHYQRAVVLAPDENNAQAAVNTISKVQALRSVNRQPMSGEGQNKPEYGQGSVSQDQTSAPSLVNLAEAYLHYDANGDGIVESIMVLYDITNRVPLFYDHVANLTPNGERPFSVVRIDPVPGRWWGRGRAEKWENLQTSLDLFFNRMIFSSSNAGRVDAIRPGNFLNWDEEKFDLNDGTVKLLRDDRTLDESLMSKVLNEVKAADLQRFVDTILQFVANGSGVSNANDAQQAGLDTAETATGVRSIQESGDDLFGKSLDDLLVGIEDALEKSVHVLFANMRDEEAFAFNEGESTTAVLVRREDMESLDLDIEVLMTKNRGEQQLAQGNQALEAVSAFYSFPPEIQTRVAALVKNKLKALNIPNVDEIVIPMAPLPPEDPLAVDPAAPPEVQPEAPPIGTAPFLKNAAA